MTILEKLEEFKRNGKEVRVYLTNKIMLEGVITDVDEKGIILDGRTVVIRENIISVVPDEEVKNEVKEG